MISKRGAPEPWDFSWMAAAVQSLETYEDALETAEFPSLILEALDELLQAPEANAIQLQGLVDVLLQMIEFPIDLELPKDTVATLHSTRDWAIQTLLDMQAVKPGASDEDALRSPIMSKSLQQMQTKLFVSAACRQADVQMELHQSLLAAVQAGEVDSVTLSNVLDMCATSLENDEQFLQFAEAALSGNTETQTFGSDFLQRLFDRRLLTLQADVGRTVRLEQRLFDALTLESRIHVWANHLPSWRSQLQKWMLETHRAPFQPISSVLPAGWCLEDALARTPSDTIAVAAAWRRNSHLYVTSIEWCRSHVDLLASCRSMDLVSTLSRGARPENAARLFNRQLLSQIPLATRSRGTWSCDQRERAFVALGGTLERLQKSRNASDLVWQYEWIGVLERPDLLHEALETTFSSSLASDVEQSPARRAARFFGWFYSFISSESADEIAALLTTMSSDLKVSDIHTGAQWLRRSRADFNSLPLLRLRLVWFWLLKSIDAELQTSESKSHATTATTDVLESVEYIFRRFTPSSVKRLFQVELVTQLLVELEWRAINAHTKTKHRFLIGIAPLCAWLMKIVRLMQLEEQTAQQKDSRRRYGDRRSSANDVQHLATRLEQFSC